MSKPKKELNWAEAWAKERKGAPARRPIMDMGRPTKA